MDYNIPAYLYDTNFNRSVTITIFWKKVVKH